MQNTFIALSFTDLKFQKEHLKKVLSDLQGTTYFLWAKDENAPGVTHCITAVRYVMEKSLGVQLPHVYIGNFIHHMVENRIFGASVIPLDEHDVWDLVFFHRKSLAHRIYMISHVWIFVDDTWNYFQSSPKGGEIESINSAINRGTIVDCRLAMKRTDPRFDFTLEKVPQ